MSRPSREDAWKLLCEFNETDVLRKHALAVEGTMRHFAQVRGEDENLWGLVGLVHDLDFEKFPEEHCVHTERILREREWPEDIIRAVLSHAWGVCTDIEPQSDMEKVLFAVDELTGLVAATALVRPSKSIHDVKVKSVKKKWKVTRFAAGVNRGTIELGAERLGVELGVLIEEVIEGMRKVAIAIGLEGDPAQG